jgi:hypothetical protein
MRVLRALYQQKKCRECTPDALCMPRNIIMIFLHDQSQAFANAHRRRCVRPFILFMHIRLARSARRRVSIRQRADELLTPLKIVAARCCLDAQRLILDDRR